MNKIIENTDKERRCSLCKTIKQLTKKNFNKDKNRPHGFAYHCKVCQEQLSNTRKTKVKNFTDEERARSLKLQREYRGTANGRATQMLCAYKLRDKEKNRICNLTKEFLINEIFNKPCTYCNTIEEAKGCDRIDNDKGHTIENVVPCCLTCNTTRMDNFTFEEMKLIGKTIEHIRVKRSLIEAIK